jgi:lipoate-protein ligase A
LLARLGVEASIQAADRSPGPHSSPFLCFQRRSPGDVLVGAVKVAGSAQRRSHSAVLQHGSLLLARSPAAPELPGLREITGQDFAVESVLEGLLECLSKRLKLNWIVEPLSQDERYGAAQLVAEKHGAEGWITQRGRTGQNPLDTRPRPG